MRTLYERLPVSLNTPQVVYWLSGIVLLILTVLLLSACDSTFDVNDERLLYQIAIIDEVEASQEVIEGTGTVIISNEEVIEEGNTVRYILQQQGDGGVFSQFRIRLSGNENVEVIYQEVITETQGRDRLIFKP